MGHTPHADIAIIGGSGLYQLEGLERVRKIQRITPFGQPSDSIFLGNLGETVVAFLARHGRGHRIPPTAINYRANIYALKALGVTRIFSVSAVGSMKESIKPGDLVLPDQFIEVDRFCDETPPSGVCEHLSAELCRTSRCLAYRFDTEASRRRHPEIHQCEICVSEDTGQEIVEVMCDAARKNA